MVEIPPPACLPEAAGSPSRLDYGMEKTLVASQDPRGKQVHVPKALSFTGLIISGLIVILFLADLAAGFPFGRTSILLDVAFMVCGLIAAYLSWLLLGADRRAR